MIRIFIYLLLSIFVITLVRMFIGIVMKGLGAYLNPGEARTARGPRPQAGPSRKGGVLRKDSYSGVYIAEDSAVAKVINGETHYFSSEENLQAYLRESAARQASS